MVTISFLNLKGGVGKTTCSLNVAVGLADRGKRVLLIDYAYNGDATSEFFEEAPGFTISDVLRGKESINDVIAKVEDNLSFIPGNQSLYADAQYQIYDQPQESQYNILKKALLPVQDQYDYCIIDCYEDPGVINDNALLASDILIIPATGDMGSLKGIGKLYGLVKQLRKKMELNLESYILFNITPNIKDAKFIINVVRAMLGDIVFKTQIKYQPKAYYKDIIVIRDGSTDISKGYFDLVDEILDKFTNAKMETIKC